MLSFRRFLLGLATLLTVVLATPCSGETSATNPFCLVEPTEAALPEYATEFGGKTYHFCCSECVRMFKANPAEYIELSEFETGNDRTGFQQWFDHIWNTAPRTFGLYIGGGIFLIVLVSRLVIPGAKRIIGTRTLVTLAMLTLTAEAISAHFLRHHAALVHEEADLIHQVHASTFAEYGYPPIPAKPDVPPRLSATFYRGNDERSSQLWNRGFYRTTDFNLDLCNTAGDPITYGDQLVPDEQFLRIRIVRAPGTPDFFWTPKRMKNIFASRSPDKLLGRGGEPIPDAVPMKVIRPMWEWEILYPLAPFAKTSREGRLKGIVYHCEKRFDYSDKQIGSRFHYAFQFDLRIEDGKIAADSDLWMGATYRNRSLRIWEIPQDEWLSTKPIPVIEGKNLTTDPKLLGIEGHVLDKN